MLDGKKTYIAGIAAILGSVAGVMSGAMDPGTAINNCVTAVLGMTIRHGIAKVGDK